MVKQTFTFTAHSTARRYTYGRQQNNYDDYGDGASGYSYGGFGGGFSYGGYGADTTYGYGEGDDDDDEEEEEESEEEDDELSSPLAQISVDPTY